jgi:carboxypeptidase T
MRTLLAAALLALGLSLSPALTTGADYPPTDAGFHSYPEVVRHLRAVAAWHPDIVRIFSIGQSHQGRCQAGDPPRRLR